MNKNAIIIFVRNPVLGKVKTRIAETAGEDAALYIYRQLLQHTHDVVKDIDADKYVFYSDYLQLGDLWEDEYFHKYLQAGNDLGDRMKHAFQRLFDKGYQNICIIGSDCYELSTAILKKAFTAIVEKNVVIGPAKDGGYYLLGMQQLYTPLFEIDGWSTATVLKNTLDIVDTLELSYQQLPMLQDIDTEEDWKKHLLSAIVQ
jgi:rSAM/selenodomain-associated transferase 1